MTSWGRAACIPNRIPYGLSPHLQFQYELSWGVANHGVIFRGSKMVEGGETHKKHMV